MPSRYTTSYAPNLYSSHDFAQLNADGFPKPHKRVFLNLLALKMIANQR